MIGVYNLCSILKRIYFKNIEPEETRKLILSKFDVYQAGECSTSRACVCLLVTGSGDYLESLTNTLFTMIIKSLTLKETVWIVNMFSHLYSRGAYRSKNSADCV